MSGKDLFDGNILLVSADDYLAAINERTDKLNSLLSNPLPRLTKANFPIFSSYPTKEIIIPDMNIQPTGRDEVHLYWNRETLFIDLFEELCSLMFRDSRGEYGMENAVRFINSTSTRSGNTIPKISRAVAHYLSIRNYSGLPAIWSNVQVWRDKNVRTAYSGIKALDQPESRKPEDLSLADFIYICTVGDAISVPVYSFYKSHPTYQRRSDRFQRLYGFQSEERSMTQDL